MTPAISICIVTHDRHDALTRCLSDLARQIDPPPYQVLIAADTDPATEAIVLASHPHATVLPTLALSLGANRNLLAAKATGALTLYLDDDTRVPPSFLADVAAVAAAFPQFDVFGGPNLTPPDAPPFEQAQGRHLANPLLTGPAALRYRPLRRPRPTNGKGLTLCNLAVRTNLEARFPENQTGGEECTLLTELHRRGARMLRHPALTVTHQRRPTTQAFAQQIFKYGFGRGESLLAPRRRSAEAATSVASVPACPGVQRLPPQGLSGLVIAPAYLLGILSARRPAR